MVMKPITRLVVCVAVLTGVSASAAAQAVRPERPYRGLFGGGVGDAEQTLSLNVSLGGGYDDNIFAGQGQSGLGRGSQVARPGTFGSLSGSLAYSYNTPRLSASLSTATSVRYAPAASSNAYGGYSGAAAMSMPLWRGAGLSASQSVGYQPYFSLQLIPVFATGDLVQATVESFDLAATNETYLSYMTAVGLSQRLSRRGSLGLAFNQRISDFSSNRPNYTSRGASAQYSVGIAKGLGAHVGYGYRVAETGTVPAPTRLEAHNINVGIDFNRALSFSRRTTLTFGTGTAAVVQQKRTRYRLTGNAELVYELARTWSTGVAYDRSVRFVENFADPIFSDGASAFLGGLVNRRLEFTSRAGVSFGQIGGTVRGKNVKTYLGTAGLTYGLTRNVGLGVNYSYYRYAFGQSAVLPAGYDRKLDRQGVRAYITLWAPLVHRARRADAAR